MTELRITLPWRILTKNNKLRIGRGGQVFLEKNFAAFQRNCIQWIEVHWGNIYFPGPVSVSALCHFRTRQSWPDADNLMKTIGDLLQKSGLVENDRLIQWEGLERIHRPGEPSGAEITIRAIFGA